MRRKVALWILIVAALLVALYAFGPRVAVDTRIGFDAAAIGDDPEGWLAAREAEVPRLRPELAKEIAWADPETRARTPLAIVYLHGFSASKGEIRPVPDLVAAEIGANLLFTRLAGHGQDGAALGEATVEDWLADLAEALAIGRLLGEQVVVIATSTGAALATWAATRPELADGIAGLVLVSPNYGVRASGAWLLSQPWGGLIAELLVGPERGFEPRNEGHGRYWTPRYPTRATLAMDALTRLARNSPVETVRAPALFVFSDDDRIVRAELTRAIAARWGAAHDLLVVTETDDPEHHLVAGDVLSPSTTAATASAIANWIRSLPR